MGLSSASRRPMPQHIWIPILCGLLIIAGESTQVMGGSHTRLWLFTFVNLFRHQSMTPHFVAFHLFLRKVGHFVGYGMLGILLMRGWLHALRKRFGSGRGLGWQVASVFGVLSVFVVACCDEIHQSFVPGRFSSLGDVMVDISGAVVFTMVFYGVFGHQKHHVMTRKSAMVDHTHTMAGEPYGTQSAQR